MELNILNIKMEVIIILIVRQMMVYLFLCGVLINMKLTEALTLDCGCIIGKGPNGEFVIQPHNKNCKTFKLALRLGEQKQNTIEYVRDDAEI